MNLLLMSSSRSADSGFLEANADELAALRIRRALFIPYAIVGEDRAERVSFVSERVAELGIKLDDIDEAADPVKAIETADAVLVSGGNTFHLLATMYRNGIVDPLRARVRQGMPYVGWSAGSNVAGRSIRTTNDMPIVYPPTFRALDLVPFQINPHFTDAMPEGLRGETREQRIREFLAAHPQELVLGLPEGTALRVEGDRMRLAGRHDAWLFRAGEPRLRLAAGRDLSHLL
ncbi:MAG TPA: dipeptidase PepE [Gammaproteobacteria bacterium]|nr:dipeptidase PepE [Gammaproteobacteria bacterium]